MTDTKIEVYIGGLLVGFVIGFMFLYLVRNDLVNGADFVARCVLGAALIIALYLGISAYRGR